MRNANKNIKIYTQLVIGFSIIGFLLIVSLYTGYTTAAQIITVEDQEHYLGSYATFTAIEFIAMAIITSGISITMTRGIRKGMKDLTNVADQLAAGKADVKIGSWKE